MIGEEAEEIVYIDATLQLSNATFCGRSSLLALVSLGVLISKQAVKSSSWPTQRGGRA